MVLSQHAAEAGRADDGREAAGRALRRRDRRIRALRLRSPAHPPTCLKYGYLMPIAHTPTTVPVIVDDAKCIADKGCTVCVDVCPLDVLRISDLTGKAYMKYDECWYCMPCEADCPTGAVTVDIPYLLR